MWQTTYDNTVNKINYVNSINRFLIQFKDNLVVAYFDPPHIYQNHNFIVHFIIL